MFQTKFVEKTKT